MSPNVPALGLALLACLCLPVPAIAAGATALSPARAGNAMNPQFSPDGARLAYEVTSPQEKITSLFLLDVDAAREAEVRPAAGSSGLGGRFGASLQVNHEFAWASKGGLYAFASSGHDNEFDLHVHGVSGAIGSDEKEGGPAFSADSRWLAFSSGRTGEGDLYVLDVFALETAARRVTSAPGLEFYADFAPKGTALAYTAMSEDGAHIRILDDATRPSGTPRSITSGKGTSLKPSWSPDGRRLAYYSNLHKQDRSRFDLYVAAASGEGVPVRLLEDVIPNERRGPSWLADSQRLVVVRNDANAGDPVILVDVVSGAVEVLPTNTVNNAEPDVTVDRRGRVLVAFVSQGVRSSEAQGWKRVWLYVLPTGSPVAP